MVAKKIKSIPMGDQKFPRSAKASILSARSLRPGLRARRMSDRRGERVQEYMH